MAITDPLTAEAAELSPDALQRAFGGDAARMRRFVRALCSALPPETVIVLRGSAVAGYAAPFEFTGKLKRVTVTMDEDQVLDGEGIGEAEMARQ